VVKKVLRRALGLKKKGLLTTMISAICNIDALINSNDEIGVWRLPGFYGNLETHKRI